MPIQIDQVKNKLFVIDVMNLGILLPCAQMQEVLAMRIRGLLILRVGLLKARLNRRRELHTMRKVARKPKKGRGRKFVGSVGLLKARLNRRRELHTMRKVARKPKKGRGRKFVGSVGLREDILEDRIALLLEEESQNNEIHNIL